MRKIKKPKIGDYVLATCWPDKDPLDPWYVSYVTDVWESEKWVVCKVSGSSLWWKHFWKIEKEEGEYWLNNFRQDCYGMFMGKTREQNEG